MSKATQAQLPDVYRDSNEEWIRDVWEVVGGRQDTLQGVTAESKPSDIDQRFAKELNALTLQERGHTLEAIHGVAKEKEESPELIERSLKEIKASLMDNSIVPPANKEAYLMAWKLDSTFVEDPVFALGFLRTEGFDAKKAALRMALYFEKKKKFFGVGTLTRSLTLDDLTKTQRKNLKCGCWQPLPVRDSRGRLVIFDQQLCGPQLYTSMEDQLQCMVYSWITLAEDQDTQKYGMVYVKWIVGTFRHADREPRSAEVFAEMFFLNRWLPVKCHGAHLCIDRDPFKKVMAELQKVTIDSQLRPYFRLHEGTTTELMYRLMPFGIPVDQFPLTTQGAIKNNNQIKWVAKRKHKEQTTVTPVGWRDPRIDLPTHKDILLGKGKPIQDHYGNMHFRFLIDEHLDEHLQSSLTEKVALTWRLVKQVKDSSGRFLKKADGGWWIEATDSEARDKVAFTFSNSLAAYKKSNLREESSDPQSVVESRTFPPGKKPKVAPDAEIAQTQQKSLAGCWGRCTDESETRTLLWGYKEKY